jgi:hypothetical protein
VLKPICVALRLHTEHRELRSIMPTGVVLFFYLMRGEYVWHNAGSA